MSDSDSSGMGVVFSLVVFVVIGICWAIWGDSQSEAQAKAKRAIEDSGFSNVVIDGNVFLACDSGDAYRLGWHGTNRDGHPVQGQACAGLFFKGWTVRLGR